jgi:hypothetical protein
LNKRKRYNTITCSSHSTTTLISSPLSGEDKHIRHAGRHNSHFHELWANKHVLNLPKPTDAPTLNKACYTNKVIEEAALIAEVYKLLEPDLQQAFKDPD